MYDIARGKIVKRTPVFHEICNITLARDNRLALISYENKAPPQLWGFHAVTSKGKEDWDLVLKHTYLPRERTLFAGLPAILGGDRDRLVLRAGTTGDIHVWHRDMGSILYCIRAPENFGHLTSFTWNRWSDDWMFATGTHEGAVHIWRVCEKEPEQTPRSPSSPLWSPSSRTPSFSSRPMMSRGESARETSLAQDRHGINYSRSGSLSSGNTHLRGSTNSSATEGIDEEDDTSGGDGDNGDDDDDN